MTNAIFVHDIVENNGKTVRQNNMELVHNIPLGSLVEVVYEDDESNGLRLFVASHSRDCDGEPLYSLTWDHEVVGHENSIREQAKSNDPIERFIAQSQLGKFSLGYNEEMLKVIR